MQPTRIYDKDGNGITSTDLGGGKRALDVNTELTANIDPTGLATELTLDDIKDAIESLEATIAAGKVQTTPDLPSGAATEQGLDDILAKLPDQSGGKMPVVQAITPDTATGDLAKLATIDAKLPASLGKKAATASFSVVHADPTRNIVGHSKTMTGAAVALSAVSVIYQKIYLLAVGAAGTTYVGDSAVTSGHGIPLNATEALCIDGPIDLANVYAIGTAPDEVAIVALYEV